MTFLADIAFYGILYGLSHLGGNIFINGAVIGVADLAAGLLLGPCTDAIGRKGWVKTNWVLCGVSCLVYGFLGSM